MTTPRTPAGEPLLVDGTGMLCVTLLMHLHKRITDAAAGAMIHVITTDPAAPLDLPAWCHLTGHTYLGPISDHAGRDVYALQLTGAPTPTRPDAPWHRTRD